MVDALNGKKVAFLLTDGYEDSELTSPWDAVLESGATATLVSPRTGTVRGERVHTQAEQHKPVGVICYGRWTLVEAGVVDGRRMTSYPSLRTDRQRRGTVGRRGGRRRPGPGLQPDTRRPAGGRRSLVSAAPTERKPSPESHLAEATP